VINSGQWRDKALGWAYNGRCLAQYDKRAWDEALLDCSMAIKLNPKDPYAYFNRGDTWRAKSDNDKAIADYGEAIRLDPKFAYAFNNRGNAWGTKGNNDKAIADYDEAIRLDPKFPYAFNNRGGAWRAKSDSDKAIADYNEAIRLDPKYAVAFHNRGSAWLARGDSDKAIIDYDEAIRLNPKFAVAHLHRGVVRLVEDSIAPALADLTQANELDRRDPYAALWLDLADRRNGQPSRLRELATKLDMAVWPAPILRHFTGEMDLNALLAGASDGDSSKANGQLCEARLYGGELALLKDSKQDAARLFRLAANDCPDGFIERSAANAELRELGASL
jgi:lipoprotein NlpI